MSTTTLSNYQNAHKWLIIPFVFTILGFMRSYYLDFTNATWHQHMHGLSATLWYIMIIVQPYLITRGHVKAHRFYGMLALILAGGVIFSGLTIIPRNLVAAASIGENPVVSPTFFYGVSFIDLITIFGFAFSVIMAIRNVRNLTDHVLWMISTVFWALTPALSRFAFIPLFAIYGSPFPFDFIRVIAITVPFILVPIIIIGYRFKQWHPALILVFIANVFGFLVRPIGDSEIWRSIADALFKY